MQKCCKIWYIIKLKIELSLKFFSTIILVNEAVKFQKFLVLQYLICV